MLKRPGRSASFDIDPGLTDPIDGLGLAGPAKWVRSLTGTLKLLR